MIVQRDVWQSIQRQLEKETHKNEDLCHHLPMGIFEKHMMPFFGNKCAICTYVYVDEFKVCNSIGAHRTTHKLIAFFYFIGNLEDKYHSQLKYVHLCLLVKEKLIKKHENLVQVLQPLIDDLNKLHHDGISVNVEGTATRLFGGLVNISAENLSVHAVACFRHVFNSGRICRQCMVLCDEKEQLLREADTTIRTESMRCYHVGAQLAKDPRLYDVENKCPFVDLPYFKVTSSFPPDVMHDLLEGVVPLTLKLIIPTLRSYCTIQQLNSELQSFSFGKNDIKNKPVTLPRNLSSSSVHGSASEKLCFLRISLILLVVVFLQTTSIG